MVVAHDDLEGAAREIVSAAFLCSGQRCTAISRVIVAQNQADELVERILAQVGRIRVGDGLEEGTTMGPLVSRGQLETVESYVRRGLESGARLLPWRRYNLWCVLLELPPARRSRPEGQRIWPY